MDQKQIQAKSGQIGKTISRLLQEFSPQSNESLCIGVYSPIAGEVLWFEDFVVPKHVSIAVAHIESETSIEFYVIELSELKSGKVGMVLGDHQLTEKVVPDLLLVPGLAFTKQGHRLGRGKGYYDRYLEKYSGQKWGICFENQIVENIPMDEFDVPMNLVITEENIYRKG